MVKQVLNIVIPVYGKNEPIERVLEQIPYQELRSKVDKIIINIVYTPNEDREKLVIENIGIDNINLRIHEERRRGYGQAYQTGFSNITHGIIATFDADGTYPIELLPNYIDRITSESIDFISINRLARYEKEAFSKRNLVGNKIITFLTNMLYGTKLKDSQSGMWVFKSNLLDKLDLNCKGMEFSTEIKIEAWKKCNKYQEINGFYSKRIDGSVPALYPWKDGLRIIKYLFKRRIKTLFKKTNERKNN